MFERTRWMLPALFCGLLTGAQVACADDHADEAEPEPPAREIDIAVISDASHERMNQTAPDTFEVLFHTTAGNFTVAVTRDWAPIGADRFYNLVNNGYYDGTRFFRVVPDFVVQWGIHGNSDVNAAWYDPANAESVNLEDDPVRESNTRGRIVFATSGPDSRSTQLFVNFGNNRRLDEMGFAPFGEVTGDGMAVLEALHDDYEMFDPRFDNDPGRKISQMHYARFGSEYIQEYFPELDSIITATVVSQDGEAPPE